MAPENSSVGWNGQDGFFQEVGQGLAWQQWGELGWVGRTGEGVPGAGTGESEEWRWEWAWHWGCSEQQMCLAGGGCINMRSWRGVVWVLRQDNSNKITGQRLRRLDRDLGFDVTGTGRHCAEKGRE